ncbi:hypothetical protein IWQ62_004171 [Dispira parvispora]|uniref:FHA domain-containing protein n=1 Tax=Dispira parvispora TaxID=1520584 RepID=A0A9W8AMF9_9FUNG|nr:hypothetical protein IWQ62_004171 [Dispira parvispora]
MSHYSPPRRQRHRSSRERYRSRSRSHSPRPSERTKQREQQRRPASSKRRSRWNEPREESYPPPPSDSPRSQSRRDRSSDQSVRPPAEKRVPATEDEPSSSETAKQQPNFGLSGKLAAETNTVRGVQVDYNEPPEARTPTKNWRLYVFKDGQQIDMFHVDQHSAYMFGRDRRIADIPTEHPSCSKQHAVLQYRQLVLKNSTPQVDDAPSSNPPAVAIKPYLLDLGSSNGTFVNGEQLPQAQYYELRSQDVIRFAHSTREYVLILDSHQGVAS